MAYECEGCGATFETLTLLRLHDCPASIGRDTSASSLDDLFESEWFKHRQRSRRRDRRRRADRATGDDLDAAIAQAHAGDATAAATAVACFERDLDTGLTRYSGDTLRDVFWGYYEKTVGAVDTVARADGWPFLLDLATAYDHRTANGLSQVTGVIANALARGVVRTRLTDGVAAIPADALAYLDTIPEYDTEHFEIAWEESQHCGWGIGHPEEPIVETILDYVPHEDAWVGGAALGALYADQTAGVSLYCEVLRTSDDRARVFAADQLSRFEGEPAWDLYPRGWDIRAEFDRDFTFTFEEEVKRQLQTTIEDILDLATLSYAR